MDNVSTKFEDGTATHSSCFLSVLLLVVSLTSQLKSAMWVARRGNLYVISRGFSFLSWRQTDSA